MERIQSARRALAQWGENITQAPRATTLWSMMLCVVVCAFFAQIIGGGYVYNIVRLGLDGYREKQEKKIDAELQEMFDVNKMNKTHLLVEEHKKSFTKRIDSFSEENKRAEVDSKLPEEAVRGTSENKR